MPDDNNKSSPGASGLSWALGFGVRRVNQSWEEHEVPCGEAPRNARSTGYVFRFFGRFGSGRSHSIIPFFRIKQKQKMQKKTRNFRNCIRFLIPAAKKNVP